MNAFVNWLDDRTGIRDLIHEALYERIPGGARWRYVWGSTLVFTFAIQVITGTFLWMCYSPSDQTAWESVYYTQYHLQGGWLLRGLHHFTAQGMVVLLVLHLIQVVIDGAYRAPREVNFWLGLILMQILLALSLTGYLLPWDQKGYWATRVATNLMGMAPVVGEPLQRLVVGGPDYGHYTLTRFFALHAGILPALLIFFLVLHLILFRRHGILHKEPIRRDDCTFWPEQFLRDAIVCFVVLAVIMGFVLWPGFHEGGFDPHRAGAELGAPADGSQPYNAARPEWYFLFLFQMLKYFPGSLEPIGAIVVPGAVMLILFLMPIIGRRRAGHLFNVGFTFLLIFGAVVPLTALALWDDHWSKDAPKYLDAVDEAHEDAERAIELANSPSGIPPTGAIALMRGDIKVRGRQLFHTYCATCHTSFDPDHPPHVVEKLLEDATASNLYGFGDRKWITGLLDPEKIKSHAYFGATKHKAGDMVGFVVDDLKQWKADDVKQATLALSAEAKLARQAQADKTDAEAIAAGAKLIANSDNCASCHQFHDANDSATAPDLTGYASRQWLIDFIRNPADKRFYGENNDRMPAFNEQLSEDELKMIVDWLRQDWPNYSPPSE